MVGQGPPYARVTNMILPPLWWIERKSREFAHIGQFSPLAGKWRKFPRFLAIGSGSLSAGMLEIPPPLISHANG